MTSGPAAPGAPPADRGSRRGFRTTAGVLTAVMLDGPKTVQELADIAGADGDVLGRILRLVASVGSKGVGPRE